MKRTTKVLIALSMILSSTSALAERLEVFRWQALDGKAAQLASSLVEAAKLHEKSGASVGVFQMDVGGSGNTTFDYVLRWDSSEAWAKTKAYNSGEEFSAFFCKGRCRSGWETHDVSGGTELGRVSNRSKLRRRRALPGIYLATDTRENGRYLRDLHGSESHSRITGC